MNSINGCILFFFRGAHNKSIQVFGGYSKKWKKELQKDAISVGIFAILCYNRIKNSYFLSVADVPRAPFGRYPEMSDISINELFHCMLKEMKKRNAYYDIYKQWITFLFLRGSSRCALRALYKRIQWFFGRYSKKWKKDLHIMYFDHIFSRVFFVNLWIGNINN